LYTTFGIIDISLGNKRRFFWLFLQKCFEKKGGGELLAPNFQKVIEYLASYRTNTQFQKIHHPKQSPASKVMKILN